MKANVQPEWKGLDAYIIGGGSSLRGFDFKKLISRQVIGINYAFNLGPEICGRVLFGDGKFWNREKWNLEKYAAAGGIVYSVSSDTERFDIPWVLQFSREQKVGMTTKRDSLGWNQNTGAAAVNLVVHLGVKRIFLLGFDMTALRGGQTHWHDHRGSPTSVELFSRHLKAFEIVANALKGGYPSVQVLNVTDGQSKLPYFDRITFKEMEAL